MLAAHLARIKRNTPVRYARDPAVDQAIRNYLAIALRARQVPGLMGGLLTHPSMGAVGHVLGSDAPLGRQLAVDLIQTNDPGPLVALLDLLAEHGVAGQHQHAPHQADMLRAVLDDLHGHIHQPGEAGPEPHPAIVRGYGQSAIDEVGTDTLNTPPHQGHLHRTAVDLYTALRDARHPVAGEMGARSATHPLDLVAMLDQAATLGNTSGHLGGTARRFTDRGLAALRDLHPVLWQYGETGQLPQ